MKRRPARRAWFQALIYLILPAFFALFLAKLGKADETIRVKFGTLAPAGTSIAVGIDTFLEGVNSIGKHTGHTIKVLGYYGGVMGDEPEMVQKARLGQLDIVLATLSTMARLVPTLEPYYLPFLVNNFGEFDYLMKQGYLKQIANEVYKRGFVLLGFITEGMYDFYYHYDGEIRTPEEARKRLKAANWTGTPHDNIWIPLRIPQVPVSVPELPTYEKMGMVSADVSPAVWVVGVQLYTIRPVLTIVQPSFFTGGAGALLSKSKFEELPWDFKIGVASMIPLLMYVANGQLRDGHYAFVDAMLKYGMKKVVLTEAEIKAWKEPLVAYRETYLKKDPAKRKSYNTIVDMLANYRKAPSPERAIYEADPEYINLPKKLKMAARAIKAYIDTGSLKELAALEQKKVIEKWRMYDAVVAAEKFAQTGDFKPLKAWSATFMPDEIVEETFAKHMDAIKRLYGSKEALKTRAQEWLAYIESKNYKGYHKRN